MIDPVTDPIPDGFRSTNTGLVVPAEHSRDQETWTSEEWDVIARAAKLAVRKGLLLRLFCLHPRCRGANDVVAMAEMLETPTGRVLRCEHADRRLYRADEAASNRQAAASARLERRNKKRARTQGLSTP